MPNRYVCDVLEEMRKCYKTRNFAPLMGLIEESQTMVNRMESSLGCKKDYNTWHNRVKAEKKEYQKLLAETNKLRKSTGKKPKEESSYP